ncbi:MAG: glycosyltransferase family 2 protein [Methylomonas sp.]|nr:glycosyltransferase family 2 protein [Methylomonas sp.]
MRHKTPTLSVIVPTHDRPIELMRCLRSIKEHIKIDFELIVVSDTTNEQIVQVASNFIGENDQFHMRKNNHGPAFSRNVGIDLARGQFVLIIDDDDEIPGVGYDDFLNTALNNTKSVTFGDVIIAREDRLKGVLTSEKPELLELTKTPFEQIWIKNYIFTQACIFPAIALAGKRQDVHMKSLEDWDFLLSVYQAAEFKPAHAIGAIIYKDYVNQGNRRGTTTAANNFEAVLDYLYVYRRWRAPSEQLKIMRANMLKQNGLDIQAEFL